MIRWGLRGSVVIAALLLFTLMPSAGADAQGTSTTATESDITPWDGTYVFRLAPTPNNIPASRRTVAFTDLQRWSMSARVVSSDIVWQSQCRSNTSFSSGSSSAGPLCDELTDFPELSGLSTTHRFIGFIVEPVNSLTARSTFKIIVHPAIPGITTGVHSSAPFYSNIRLYCTPTTESTASNPSGGLIDGNQCPMEEADARTYLNYSSVQTGPISTLIAGTPFDGLTAAELASEGTAITFNPLLRLRSLPSTPIQMWFPIQASNSNNSTNQYATIRQNFYNLEFVPTAIPSAPTSPSVDDSAATGVTVSWSPPTSNAENVTSYDVALCTDGSCTVVGDDLSVTTYTAPASSLTVGTAYTFQILANSGGGQSPALETGSFTWAIQPSAPQNFACSGNINSLDRSASISCTWEVPAIPKGLDTYRISYSINNAAIQTADVAGTVLTYTYPIPYDASRTNRLVNTSTFVTAYSGTTAGVASSTVDASVLTSPPPVTNFQVTNVANGVTLQWTAPDVTAATGEEFRIRYGVFDDDGECDGLNGESDQTFTGFPDANELGSTVREYRNTAQVSAGNTYCFEILVRKRFPVGTTGFSTKFFRTATIIATADPPNPPTEPDVTVQAAGVSASTIDVQVSWTASATGTYTPETYGVTLYSGSDQTNRLSFNDVAASNTSHLFTGLTLGATYNFTIDARRTVGNLMGISATVGGEFTLLAAPSFTTSPTITTIAINVSAVSGVTYEYAYKLDADSAWTSSASATITGLTAETVYDIRVRASGGIGFTDSGNVQSTMTTPWIVAEDISTLAATAGGPNDPTNLESVAFSSATGSLRCTWQAPSGGLAVEGYEAGYKAQSAASWTSVELGSDILTRTFSPVTVDTLYQCRIRSFRTEGTERRYSGWVTGTAVAYPQPPSNLAVFSSADPQRLRVFWNNSNSPVSSQAKKAISFTFSGTTTTVDDIAASATSHFATIPAGASAGDTVAVSIFSYLYDDTDNRSASSAAVNVVIADASTGAPDTPSNVQLNPRVNIVSGEVDGVLTWNQTGNDPVAYEIDYREFNTPTWTVGEAMAAGDVRTFDLSGLETGVTYLMRIRSYNNVNIGGAATERRYTPYVEKSIVIAGQRIDPADCMFALTVPAGGTDAPTSLSLSWTNPADIQQNAEVPTAMIVQWRSATSIAYTVVRLAGTASEYTLPVAADGSRYDVQLRAEFGNGDGFSPVLVASLVVGTASESVECEAASDYIYPSLPLPPEVFDIHLAEIDGDRDRVSIRWTIDEDARLYEVRQISTSQDPTTLASYGFTNAVMEASSSGARGGYAAEGHLIPNAEFVCATMCYLGTASPMNVDGLRYEIVLDRQQFPVLAMYVDQDVDSFYLVLEGDAVNILDSSNSDWLIWNSDATIHRIEDDLTVATSIFDYRTTLDPVFAAEIYNEPIPVGAFSFGTATTRTVVRWGAGGQSEQYGVFDPILPRPTLTPYQGSAFPVPATEHQVYVLHGTESWFSIRSLYPSGEYSAYSAPRHYQAGPLLERIIPFGEDPASIVTPDPSAGGDFGVRALLQTFGIGSSATQRDGIAVAIAGVIALALGAVGFMFTPDSNVQTRMGVTLLLSITTWMVTAPTIGQLPFSFVAAPLILLSMAGIVAVLRRAG